MMKMKGFICKRNNNELSNLRSNGLSLIIFFLKGHIVLLFLLFGPGTILPAKKIALTFYWVNPCPSAICHFKDLIHIVTVVCQPGNFKLPSQFIALFKPVVEGAVWKRTDKWLVENHIIVSLGLVI